jgi:hypothetical protein
MAPQLGEWFKEHHQQSYWCLDSDRDTLYHHSSGIWEHHMAQSRARLRLYTMCDIVPAIAPHVIEVKVRPRFIEIMDKWKISPSTIITLPIIVPYTSDIGTCMEALPCHVQRLVGDIPTVMTQTGWDPTTPVNISIATDWSVTFGVGYHS